MDETPNIELAAAAEALIKAATRSKDVDSITHRQLSITLEGLTASFSSGLNNVNQTLAASNSDFDGKINTTKQHLSDLKREVSDLKEAAVKVATLLATQTIVLLEQQKQQRLFWAQANTKLGSFKYYVEQSYNTVDSSALVADIISWFIRGYGRNLDSSCSITDSSYNRNSNKAAEGQEAFRVQLKKQIKDLIGREPRLTKGTDGTYALYYE